MHLDPGTNSLCRFFLFDNQRSVPIESGGEEASFPLDLEEEAVTPMMVDEPQIYEESSLTQVIEGFLGELELEGAMIVWEGVEEVPESLVEEIPAYRVYEEGMHAEVENEEDVLEVHLEVKEGDEV